MKTNRICSIILLASFAIGNSSNAHAYADNILGDMARILDRRISESPSSNRCYGACEEREYKEPTSSCTVKQVLRDNAWKYVVQNWWRREQAVFEYKSGAMDFARKSCSTDSDELRGSVSMGKELKVNFVEFKSSCIVETTMTYEGRYAIDSRFKYTVKTAGYWGGQTIAESTDVGEAHQVARYNCPLDVKNGRALPRIIERYPLGGNCAATALLEEELTPDGKGLIYNIKDAKQNTVQTVTKYELLGDAISNIRKQSGCQEK